MIEEISEDVEATLVAFDEYSNANKLLAEAEEQRRLIINDVNSNVASALSFKEEKRKKVVELGDNLLKKFRHIKATQGGEDSLNTSEAIYNT